MKFLNFEFDRDDVIREIRDAILILAGVFSASLSLKSFLLPNHFIDGGITGISLLVNHITHVPLAILILFLNIPFVILGYSHVSKVFAFKTMVGIGLLALSLTFFEFPTITKDKLLISIFGGFFLGAGIGLAIRGGGVLDGTEVLAMYISRRTAFSIGDLIMVINVVIFTAAALVLDIEQAMYSLITYITASKTVDFINHGIEEYTGVTIISDKSESIRQEITDKLGIGATVFKGQKGYGKRRNGEHDINILYTVVTRLELPKLKNAIDDIDEKAFLIEQSISDVKGGIVRKKIRK